jgi:hypothetical protein
MCSEKSEEEQRLGTPAMRIVPRGGVANEFTVRISGVFRFVEFIQGVVKCA